MKVIHLLASGGAGGIETLNKDFAEYSKHDNIFLFVWYGGCITEEMKASRKRVIELKASKKDFLGPLKKILMLCKQEKVDAIMVHHASPVMHMYAMIVKKVYQKIAVITYAHGNAIDMCRTNKKKGLLIRRWIMKESLNRADRVVAISRSVRDSLIDYFNVKEEKIDIVYNGVDINRFENGFHQSGEIVEIVYVGRLIEQKGVQNTLQALALLSTNVKYRFRIIGDGVYRNELELLVKRLELENCVEFLGTRRDVPKLLQSSDIFVHIPSWEEGFGITIVEAMAAGLVPVCAYSGAISEIIENKKNGILVERENVQSIANILKTLIENIDREWVIEMRLKASERAKQFSSVAFSKNLDQLLFKITENKI